MTPKSLWGYECIENQTKWVNSAMIYCKNFGKCSKYPQYNNNLKRKRKENKS
jgi:hypothetical protein